MSWIHRKAFLGATNRWLKLGCAQCAGL